MATKLSALEILERFGWAEKKEETKMFNYSFRAERTYPSLFLQNNYFLPKYLRFGPCQFKLTLAAGEYVFF